MPKYSRILLKLSGESLAGGKGFGIDMEAVERYAGEILEIIGLGAQVAVVVGGGNFWRGRMAPNMERASADQMGMMATVMNGLALRFAIEKLGGEAVIQSAIGIQDVAEPFILRRAIKHLVKGRVIIFVGGTGSAYFTTDSAAALRALQINADILMKATRVNGVYDKDPEIYSDSKFFSEISCREALNMGLKVMDSTAISLCMDNHLPIMVLNVSYPGNLVKAVNGEKIGSLVKEEIKNA